MASTLLTPPATTRRPAPSAPGTPRRYRREASLGERCPQCAGPIVFGEGCSLCPICGYSGC